MLGVTMGYIFTALFQYTVIVGMNGALETLVSQAHGAGELGLCGAIYKRGWLIGTFLHIPIVLILCFTG